MTAVAVAGMHRTGTSMVAKALRLAGLYLGEDEDLVEAAPDNPEGFYEHAGIVTCNDDLLEVTGGAWDHPPPCPPLAADDPRVVEVADKARKTIAPLAVTGTWGWKDPRTSLTARFWLDLVPDLRVVVCVRHPLEVALSLKRRNRSSYAHGLALWHSYYHALLDTVPEDRRIVTHYDAHLNNGGDELERLLRFAHLDPAAAGTALSAANPQLRHHRIDVALGEAGVARATIDLYHRLCEEAGQPLDEPEAARAPATLDRTRLDLALAEEHLEQRQRQIDSLREERTRLESRLARVEDTVDRLGALAGLDGRLETRFEALTAAVTDATYRVTGVHDREYDPVVRGCRELVGRHTGQGDAVLVIAKGDPALLDLYGRATLNFPHHASRRYPGYAPPTATSAIAHLEALRLRGVRFLLIPDTARWWLDHYASFAAHVMDRYRVVDDEPAGLLVDLAARPGTDHPSSEPLTRTISRISAAAAAGPAVLDWTDRGLGRHLPDHNVFVPPDDGLVLPYLEGSIDVVVIADDQRTREARRVASKAVVRIDDVDGVPRVAELMTLDGEDGAGGAEAPLTVVVDPGGDDRWLSHVRDLIDRETNVSLRATSRSVALNDGIAGYAVLLDPGVLPLPGWATTVRTTLAAHPTAGALAVCLLDASGGLEAAGAVVFDDASWAGVGRGSPHVSAPWHNFVRPTCAAPGMAVVRGDLAAAAGGYRSPLAWAATLWQAGQRVLYQPEVWAVRAQGASTAALLDAQAAEAWAPVLASRPERPEPLDDRAWRGLIARDDIEACWGLR
jgi:hypothetical protein